MSQDTTAPAVRAVTGAVKRFGDIKALDDASLALLEGERLALLGPNGAGKTTLLRAVTGRVRLERGTIELFGASASRCSPDSPRCFSRWRDGWRAAGKRSEIAPAPEFRGVAP